MQFTPTENIIVRIEGLRRRRRWDLGTTQKNTKKSNIAGIRCSEDGYAVVNHIRSEHAVVSHAVVMIIRCSDARSDIVRDSGPSYAVVRESRCIVEQVEDPKKWLTNLTDYAIIVPQNPHSE